MARVTLAGARISAGYTQETLAETLGVSRNLITNMEGGKIPIKPFYVLAICQVTGFSPSDILLPESVAKGNTQPNATEG